MSPERPRKPGTLVPDEHATWLPDGTPIPAGPTAVPATSLPTGIRSDAPELPSRYQVLELLGKGGMGSVWKVHDHQLRRDLAMKVLHASMVHRDALTRFQQEAQISGQLEHPNIVPVHDFGRTIDDCLYFTMKEVRGDSLHDVLHDRWLDVQEGQADHNEVVVELVSMLVRVCEALAFAHARGVIHRDLKPANIMIGEFGEVQVMDWGLARLASESTPRTAPITSDRLSDNPLQTQAGWVAGTPAFMAPEQARGETDRMGPHSDIWALGAILYHMIAGKGAFNGDSDQVLDKVRAAQVVPPSRVSSRPISRELEAAVLRAMAAEPKDRYRSADAMRVDLQAWLNGRPLSAASYSNGQLIAKWARRNRGVITGVAVTATVAISLLAWGLARYIYDLNAERAVAEAEAERAQHAEIEARVQLAEGRVATADALVASERYAAARTLYRDAIEGLQTHKRTTIGAELGLWSTYHLSRGPIGPLDGTLLGMHPNGRSVLTLRDDGLHQVGLPRGLTEHRWPRAKGEIEAASYGDEGWRIWVHHEGALYRTVLDQGTPERLLPLGKEHSAMVSPSGEFVLTYALDQGVDLWHQQGDSFVVTHLSDDLSPSTLNDRHAVLSRYGGHSELWDLQSGTLLRQLDPSFGRAKITPDGRSIALRIEPAEELRLEDLLTGEVRWSVPADYRNPRAFSPDGATLFAVGLEPGITALDMATGEQLFRMDGHQSPPNYLYVTEHYAVSSSDHIMLWSTPDPEDPLGRIAGMDESMREVDVHEATGLMVAASTDRLAVWDLESGVQLPGWPIDGTPSDVQLDPQGRRVVVTLTDNDESVVIDLVTGQRQSVRSPAPRSAVFLDAETVALGSNTGDVHALKISDGSVQWHHTAPEPAPRWDLLHDAQRGLLYASAFRHPRVDVFDTKTGDIVRTLNTEYPPYTLRLHAPTGDVSVGITTRKGLVFDVEGSRTDTLVGHAGPVLGQEFSPDGRMLATADYAGPVRIFDLDNDRVVRTDRVQDGAAVRIWWTDEDRLLTVSGSSALYRDLQAAKHLPRGGELLGPDSVAKPAELAHLLALHGLHADAAPLWQEAGAKSIVQTRAWWLAGDVDKARKALAESDVDDPLHAGWRRLLAD